METRRETSTSAFQSPSNPETAGEVGLFEAEDEFGGVHDDEGENERGGSRVLGVFEVDVSTLPCYQFTDFTFLPTVPYLSLFSPPIFFDLSCTRTDMFCW